MKGQHLKHSWEPTMSDGARATTEVDYWLNWRFFLCIAWVASSAITAAFLIWRHEGREAATTAASGTLYEDESWKPCLKGVHPAWLLAYRLVAFLLLLSLLVINVVVEGGGIFYYYTQWSFLLLIIYFGLGSLLSVYGCHKFLKFGGNKVVHERVDAEQGTYVSSIKEENGNLHGTVQISSFSQEHNVQETAGFWVYMFQIIYQTNAGAVMLTDIVFWLILFPYLVLKDYNVNFLLVSMHSVNVFFLLGDIALNSLRFPWFRIAYFLLWTSIYVIFQWIVHACISIWWPYPFLDLSSPHAPLWYFVVAVLQVPCYTIFPLIIKMKHSLLLRWYPDSYQCTS